MPTKSDGETTQIILPEQHVFTTGNRLVFYSDVDSRVAAETVTYLHALAAKLQQEAIQNSTEVPPIHLHIHSYGGELLAGIAIMEAIKQCPLPVHTHIEGCAASAATLFSVAGDYRTIGEDSFILIHQLSDSIGGKFEEIQDAVEGATKMMGIMVQIYRRYTKLPKRKLDGLLKRDLWLTAQEALDFGLVDEVLTK